MRLVTPKSPYLAAGHSLIRLGNSRAGTQRPVRYKPAAPRTYVWPIPGTQQTTLYLEANHSLSRTKPTMQGRNVYHVDFEASAGPANRWATQAGGPRIDYGNRALERIESY